MNRKDIFISGFKSKIGYSFTYKDLTEFETVINFYEQQVQKQKEVINNIQNFIKEFHKNRNTFKWNEQDYIDVILKLEKMINEKEVSE